MDCPQKISAQNSNFEQKWLQRHLEAEHESKKFYTRPAQECLKVPKICSYFSRIFCNSFWQVKANSAIPSRKLLRWDLQQMPFPDLINILNVGLFDPNRWQCRKHKMKILWMYSRVRNLGKNSNYLKLIFLTMGFENHNFFDQLVLKKDLRSI